LPTTKLSGTVFSGTGQGKKFVDLPWVKRQFKEKTGFTAFSGTLNIRLNKESTKQRSKLDTLEGIRVEPEVGYYPGLLFRAKIDSIECFIVIPKMQNYPKDVLEIISPIILREKLKLKDDDTVTVEVTA
jgi:riboflavin kinase